MSDFLTVCEEAARAEVLCSASGWAGSRFAKKDRPTW